MWRIQDPSQKYDGTNGKSVYRSTFQRGRDSCLHTVLDRGYYSLMPCTFNSGDKIKLYVGVYSEEKFNSGEIGILILFFYFLFFYLFFIFYFFYFYFIFYFLFFIFYFFLFYLSKRRRKWVQRHS